MELVGKRGMQELGSRINNVAGQGMSDWARKLLEKQGWKGGGLGKNQDGITDYVKVKQREESAGLGIEEHDRAKGQESWWYNSFEAALQSVKVAAEEGGGGEGKKKKKKKKKKKDNDKKKEKKGGKAQDGAAAAAGVGAGSEMRVGGVVVPTYDELFKATGGKRLGMRARASQKAKWARTEHLEALAGQHHHHTTSTTLETTTKTEEDEVDREGHHKKKVVTTTTVQTTVVESESGSDDGDGDDKEAERRRRKREKKEQKKKRKAAAAEEAEQEAEVAEPKAKKQKKKKKD